MDKIYLDHVSYIYGVGMPYEIKALDANCKIITTFVAD